MTNEKIAAMVDHTLLKPFATMEQIIELCDEAVKYNCASVCIPPCYIAPVKEKYGDTLMVATVVGFPLGYMTKEAKTFECADAISKGADEVDMVINIADVKNGDYDAVEAEIRALKEACGDHVLKVIIETCYLEDDEKAKVCQAATRAGADFVKTSTGFGTAGATLPDIAIMKANISEDMKIKAAGGIRTKEDMVAFIEAGCSRLGCSSTKVLF